MPRKDDDLPMIFCSLRDLEGYLGVSYTRQALIAGQVGVKIFWGRKKEASNPVRGYVTERNMNSVIKGFGYASGFTFSGEPCWHKKKTTRIKSEAPRG